MPRWLDSLLQSIGAKSTPRRDAGAGSGAAAGGVWAFGHDAEGEGGDGGSDGGGSGDGGGGGDGGSGGSSG